MTILKAALNHAWNNEDDDHKIAKSDSAWRNLQSFENVEGARVRYITDAADAKRLINAADKESGFRDLLHAALLTGCRYGETARLTVGDYVNGKLDVLFGGKTRKRRTVRLTAEGRRFFDQLTAGRSPTDLMLPRRMKDENGHWLTREWRKSEQERPMHRACEAARVPYINFHAMRHTWASHAIMAGAPLLVAAHNLGHSDTRMVEKHYGHLAESYVDEMIEQTAPGFGAVEKSNITRINGR